MKSVNAGNIIGAMMILAFVACEMTPGDKTETDASRFDRLEAQIDTLLSKTIKDDGPGAAVLVSYDGEMILGKSMGLSNIEENIQITLETNMRVGSISKQFTVLAILSLVDQGRLRLSDTVYNIWPFDVFRGMTVNHLITHTSGLANYYTYFENEWNRDKAVQNGDILDWYATNPAPSFQVGERFEYTDAGYIILALIVEKTSGMSFASYVRKHVFEKANMQNTSFFDFSEPDKIRNKARRYREDTSSQWTCVDGYFMDGTIGGMGVYTNVMDFFKYDNALRSHSIISKKGHESIFRPQTLPLPEDESYHFDFLEGEDQYYAMGWFVTRKTALHGGSWKGARAMVVKSLEKPLTIVVFMNFDSSIIRYKLTEKTFALVNEYLENARSVK
jgi:CubicO group peptidase (beta-lactamase class C family)